MNGGQRDYGFADVLHVAAFGGVAPITLGREAIGLSMTLETHAAQLFGSGARPSAILTKQDKAGGSDGGATAISNMRKAWRATFGSGINKDPLFLDDGWTYNQAALTSTDAQFAEMRVEQVREIARLFGIPPHMLFELSDGTYSNTEEMGRSFLQLCLRPWLDRWQDAYATVLLNEDERDSTYFEFVVDDLQRADAAARADVFGKLIAARVLTPNEVRSTMNMPPRAGGDELANPYTTSGASTPTPPKSNP